jgi:hypothetical protein
VAFQETEKSRNVLELHQVLSLKFGLKLNDEIARRLDIARARSDLGVEEIVDNKGDAVLLFECVGKARVKN